jgi:glycosyltransferase involved in cell wall biosynthesis
MGHVLHVVPGLAPGGVELALARIVSATEGETFHHSVVCLTGEPAIADLFPRSVNIHCLHSPPNDPRLPWRLRRLIRVLRPTAIHARNWGAWPDVAVARLLSWPPVPLIFSFHGFAAGRSIPLRRRLAFRVLSRLTPYLLTVCDAAKRMLIEELGWPKRRVRVIPNGVDTGRFSPRSDEIGRSKRIVIGAVGNLTPVKDHALLLRAFAEAVRGGMDGQLRIAGDGLERAALESLARELGIADRLSLPGFVADVPDFLRQLDMFVLPSASEAHPNALIEAMSCGLPCVATDVGGVAEVLDDGRFGRLVTPSDSAGLATSLRELGASPESRLALGRSARARVIDRYSMEGMTAAYTSLYQEVSARGRRKALPETTPSRRSVRPSVLQLGPLPPLTGGMATVTCNLRDSDLNHWCELETINNGKMTPEGRPLLAGVWSQIRLLCRILAAVQRRRVRLVHIHTCALFSFWRDIVHMTVVRAMGCRVIWHLHDGTFPRFISEGSRLKRAVIRWALRRAAATILLSETTLQALRPHAPGVKWAVVPNGVPLPEQRPDGNGSGNGDGTSMELVFLGNLTRRKGAYDLIAAVEKAVGRGANANLSLAGGETAPGQRQEIEQHLAESPCASRIRLLGLVQGEQKQIALSEADCVALPSYAEGLPMALLEGMAAELPVIATRVGSIPALVAQGVEGFLVSPGDVDALADCICRLTQDPALRRRMGRKARERVERDFSQRAMAERVFQIYQSVLSGGTRPVDEVDLSTNAIRA